MDNTVEIASALVTRIMRTALIARPGVEWGDNPDHEWCGILRGSRDSDGRERVTRADLTKNVAADTSRSFEIDPAALIAAYKNQRRPRALAVLGFFHTHPSGDPWPSQWDADDAAPDGKLWLIATTLRARLWRSVPNGQVRGRFDPVRFDLKVGKRVEKGLLEVQHVDFGRNPDDFVIIMEPPL